MKRWRCAPRAPTHWREGRFASPVRAVPSRYYLSLNDPLNPCDDAFVVSATLPVGLPASHHSRAPRKSPLSPLFAASSKTLQESAIRGSVTPLFSILLLRSYHILCTPKEISLLFAHSSEKGWGTHPSPPNRHYIAAQVLSVVRRATMGGPGFRVCTYKP
jgi:hypothetical protein